MLNCYSAVLKDFFWKDVSVAPPQKNTISTSKMFSDECLNLRSLHETDSSLMTWLGFTLFIDSLNGKRHVSFFINVQKLRVESCQINPRCKLESTFNILKTDVHKLTWCSASGDVAASQHTKTKQTEEVKLHTKHAAAALMQTVLRMFYVVACSVSLNSWFLDIYRCSSGK